MLETLILIGFAGAIMRFFIVLDKTVDNLDATKQYIEEALSELKK